MFIYTSLLGAQDSISFASQSLLELDGGIKILIDVGWDEGFDVEKLREIEKQTQTISLILLTHPTIKNLGGFAHACKHFPLFTRIPVYATTPVISLGRTLLQDLYTTAPLASTIIPPSSLSEASYSYSQSQSNSEESHILRQPPTLDEITSYFALIHPLKYSQPYQPLASPFSPPLGGLTITAFNAGHTLGGTIWHIQHGLESIVYAVDWNQGRENVLSGAAWLGGAGAGGAEVIEQLRKPTALICSSKGSERVALSGGRTRRDELLLDMIRSAVAKGGIVLIPTDSSARVLELAYILEHAWRKESSDKDSPIGTTRLFLASKNINATLRYAKSMLEWMDESIVREFETDASAQANQQHGQNTQGRGPFDFRHMRLLEKKSQVERVLNSGEQSIGKVILASDSSLEWGFSKEILRSIAADSRNMIILTERLGTPQDKSLGQTTGLARTLWSWYEERKDGIAPEAGPNGESLEQIYGGGRELEIRDAKRVPLEDNELLIYQQWLATQRQLQTTLQTGFTSAVDPTVDAIDDASSESSSESEGSETEQQGKALNALTSLGQANRKKIGLSDEDLGINILLRRKGVHDFDVRGKKGREKMFPLAVRRKRTDDFGDMIRPEEYLRDEERDELDAEDVQPVGKYESQETLGKKRKWDNVATGSDQKMLNGASKRQQNLDGRREDGDGIHDSGLTSEDAKEDAEEVVTGPSKVVYSKESITVNLRLAFVDFAGLHDKRALQMLIPLINPRKLILVSGTEDEITTLANDCRKLLAAKSGAIDGGKEVDVFTPAIGVSVDASVDTNAWVVKLTDNLVRRLRWQNVKGLGIVTLTGHLVASSQQQNNFVESESSNKKQKTQKEAITAVTRIQAIDESSGSLPMPSLDVVPTSMASATRSVAQPLHVGDLRLADLRKILQSSGHTAEFRGEGTLLIDSSVAVRKTGTGKIEIENNGTLTSSAGFQQGTFYAVKKKIYEGLAVVAGG